MQISDNKCSKIGQYRRLKTNPMAGVPSFGTINGSME